MAETKRKTTRGTSATKETVVKETTAKSTAPTEGKVILYGKLKTLMNIRKSDSMSAQIITTYKKDTFVEIIEICGEWYKIKCAESDTGYAYVSNKDKLYVLTGKEIYKVKSGETIFKIAHDKLGNSNLAEEILSANEMTSSTVKVGMKLLIP